MDIKKYEQDSGNNILSFFYNISIDNILDLISLGNGCCSKERASEILDGYLENDGTLLDAFIEIKYCLIGVGDNDDEDDNTDKIDITEYDSLTDLYIRYSMELMSVGLGYTEFWDMTTKEMYKVFNSIIVKLQNETNRELSNYHTLAAMVGGAVWGKLDKEPPKVDFGNINKDLDDKDAIMVAKLQDMAKRHNEKVMTHEGR